MRRKFSPVTPKREVHFPTHVRFRSSSSNNFAAGGIGIQDEGLETGVAAAPGSVDTLRARMEEEKQLSEARDLEEGSVSSSSSYSSSSESENEALGTIASSKRYLVRGKNHAARAVPRQPLIERIKNDWRKDPPYLIPEGEFYYLPNIHDGIPTFFSTFWQSLKAIVNNRKIRRFIMFWLIIYLVVTGVSLTFWKAYGRQKWEEHRLWHMALRRPGHGGWFGASGKLSFDDLTVMKTLDASVLPAHGNPEVDGRKRRLIFVGDVHGCKDELMRLLRKVDFDPKSDHLVFTGDMISKGPSSGGVVDFAISVRASGVRGNHEDRVLLLHKGQNIESSVQSAASAAGHSKTSDHKHLAQSLTDRQISYLKSLPVILHIGNLPGIGDVAVAHAGLVPGVPLSEQDAVSCMTMRSLDLETHVPSRERAKSYRMIWWATLWNKFQGRVSKKQRTTVIYGHDSKKGLQIHRYSRGLDTSCVYGGRLTALVMEEVGKEVKKPGWFSRGQPKPGDITERVVSVECDQAYEKTKEDSVQMGDKLKEYHLGQQ